MQDDLITLADAPIVLVPLCAKDGSVRAFAIIDKTDAEWVGLHRWRLSSAGYAVRSWGSQGRYMQSYLHREILGLVSGDKIEGDHINRNKLDNRRANLRRATRRENSQNMPSVAKTSPYRGVSWHTRSNRWRAQVRVNGHRIWLGNFSDELKAAEAARAARAKYLPGATD